MNEPANQPITNAVYGKKAAVRKPSAAKPARKARGSFVGEIITPHEAAALVALREELQRILDRKKSPRGRRKG